MIAYYTKPMQRQSHATMEKPLGNVATYAVVFAALWSLGASPALAGKLYRWVDENGHVYFSDKVPPEDIKLKHQELNKQGMVIDTIEAAKTPEQIAEEERQEKLRAEEEKRRKEIELHDQWLVSTFRDENDLIQSRDAKIDALESATKLTRDRITRLKDDLEHLRTQAADHERGGSPVPDDLLRDIKSLEQQINDNTDYVSKKTQEQEQLRAQYDKDLKRLRELRGVTTTENSATAQ